MDEKQQLLLVQYIAILRRGNDQQKAQVRQLALLNDQIAAAAVNISDAADKGDLKATQMVALVENMIDLQQQLTTYAKMGAKLNYLKLISGNCPDGYEIVFMKNGGQTIPVKRCKKCELKKKMSAVEEFKCGGKKKVKKAEIGAKSPKITSSTKSNTDDGYEVEHRLSDGTSVVQNFERGRLTGIYDRLGRFFSGATHKTQMDSTNNEVIKNKFPNIPTKKKK